MLKYIWYYIVYRKFRILVSNTWFQKGVDDNLIYYYSESGGYELVFYSDVNFIDIYKNGIMNFMFNDAMALTSYKYNVSEYFLEKFKYKLLNSEIAYKRNKKLNRFRLG